MAQEQAIAGRVIGTEDATPLEFWVAIDKGAYLQLDDVVALQRVLPTGEVIRIYGMVTQVRARHDGARFDGDVFLIEDGLLPATISESAKVLATRFEPETFVPPLPGAAVRKAEGAERDTALYFDGMKKSGTELAIGLSRNGEPVYANLEFLNGSRGAHVNISGVSGVATKTTYALFLLYSLFHSAVLGDKKLSTRALVFNVKGGTSCTWTVPTPPANPTRSITTLTTRRDATAAALAGAAPHERRRRTDVVALPLDPPLSRQIGWVRRKGRQLPPVAIHLLESLRSG